MKDKVHHKEKVKGLRLKEKVIPWDQSFRHI
jgi:hypothetical protein